MLEGILHWSQEQRCMSQLGKKKPSKQMNKKKYARATLDNPCLAYDHVTNGDNKDDKNDTYVCAAF